MGHRKRSQSSLYLLPGAQAYPILKLWVVFHPPSSSGSLRHELLPPPRFKPISKAPPVQRPANSKWTTLRARRIDTYLPYGTRVSPVDKQEAFLVRLFVSISTIKSSRSKCLAYLYSSL
eukprot:scaffold421377_cov55-Attheya_sp.AAC.6